MSEENTAPDGERADQLAISLALAGASRTKADAFLDDQRHHLHEQERQVGLRLWELRLGVFLRLATAVVGVAVAAALGLMVWDAAHSKGLLIEPFSVPPEMAARGLTGQVVAAQLLDKLAILGASESSRSTQSYANNWGNDIKVEIPETGVSISELERYLRGWLGHDTRISGEVYRTASGIAVTARAGSNGATFTGSESDLDALVQKSAEHVFETTQPYRYANYLDRNYNPVGAQERVARATAIYRKLIAGDDPVERAWAWNGLGTIEFNFHQDNRRAAAYYRKALATVPDFTIAYYALASRNGPLGQEEGQLVNLREAARLLRGDSVANLNPKYAGSARLSSDAQVAALLGEFATAIAIAKQGAGLPDDFSVLARGTFINTAMVSMARRHDWRALRAFMRDLGWAEIPAKGASGGTRVAVDVEGQDWRDILAIEADRERLLAKAGGNPQFRSAQNPYDGLRPAFALAQAHLGNFPAAEKLLAPLAPDRDAGLRTRALIAELRSQHARADWWFARSEKQTPSIPFTDVMWGQALLARGQPDAAIEKFKLANQKGPRFADPLEGWGEALMAKNQSHLALAKFTEAEKYAPNWGQLYLKWGEALVYAGKPEEAKAQFGRAAQLDFTPSEKAELARANHG
jgi:tetratricopeptide (TPR) repeat protein